MTYARFLGWIALVWIAPYESSIATVEQWVTACDNWNSADFFEHATIDHVSTCINEGVDANERDMNNMTPVHWAAAKNTDPAVIELLIQTGADPMARVDAYGVTPLHLAAGYNSNPDVIESLVAAGSNANSIDNSFGATPLHWAAMRNENPEVFRVLLRAGASIEALDNMNMTPLDYVRENTQFSPHLDRLQDVERQ